MKPSYSNISAYILACIIHPCLYIVKVYVFIFIHFMFDTSVFIHLTCDISFFIHPFSIYIMYIVNLSVNHIFIFIHVMIYIYSSFT